MKKHYFLLYIIGLFITPALFAQQAMQVKTYELRTLTANKPVVTDELEKLTPASYRQHPEYGINPYNTPCTDCIELVDRRTEDSRYFVKKGTNGSEFYVQKGYAPLHYKDEQGNWISIDPNLKATNQPHLYKAVKQHLPVTVDAGLGLSSIQRGNGELKFNNQLELFYDNGTALTSLGKANWTNYTVGNEGIKVTDAWPGIDMELKVLEGKVKSDFIFKERPQWNTGKLVLRDNLELPANHSFTGITPNQIHLGDFAIVDSEGNEAYHIYNAYAWDAAATPQVEEFNYKLIGNALDIEIPLSWLNADIRTYPVTVDPLVTATNTIPLASITGSTYNATCWANGCSYNMSLAVPPNCTVTDVLWSFNYQTLGGCVMDVGALDLRYGACRSPNVNTNFWTCNAPNPGTCNGNNISVFSDFAGCVPNPQCASYNMNFIMNFYRCSTPGANCSNLCIGAATGWTMTVQGRTVQTVNVTGAQVICAGQSVNLNATGVYGVSPYSIVWNPGGLTGSPVSVSPTVTTPYTVTVTDACGQTATSTVTVNVTNVVNPGFTLNPISICQGGTVTLTGLGSGGAPSYDWLTPGGNVSTISNLQTATVTYPSAGTFNVTLNYNVNGCFAPLVQPVTVNMVGFPTATIYVNEPIPVCAGKTLIFTAVISNQGTNPIYDWKHNGVSVSSGTSYTTSSYNNNDVITLTITSNAPCISPSVVTSAPVVIQVTPVQPASISITASPTGTVCAGTPITFTSTPVNQGTQPAYVWYVNGSQTANYNSTFTTSSLNNGDQVYISMISNLLCASPTTAISNTIPVTIAPPVTPSVSITQVPTGTQCAGTNITYTATAVNGGPTPTYQWTVNGVPVGTNSATFSSTTLQNSDIVRVTLVSSAPCATPASVNSNQISVSINPVITPTVSIVSSPVMPVCTGTNLVFTATPLNAGVNPNYQWKVNGANVGTNSTTFSSSTLNNGDVVTVILTSTYACANPTTATSNAINVSINSLLVPAVSVTANPTGPICPGTSVTFTATPTNGGVTPVYQWRVNGVNVGTNSSTYTTTTLGNGDAVTLNMVSSIACVSPNNANSTPIVITVTPPVAAGVSIAQTPAGAFCAGTNVTFTATPVNGGANPSYQWTVNGVNAGTNAATFSSSTLANGDVVLATITSNAACANPATANSNQIAVVVNPVITPSVAIAANPALPVCAGTNVTFTATPTTAGTNPSYQWQVNGINVGTNSNTFATTTLANGDQVTVTLTSTNVCANPASVTSNTINATINPLLTPSVGISASPSGAICAGANVTFTAVPTNGGNTPSYQWTVNGVNAGSNAATFNTTGLNSGDVVEVTLTSSAACTSPTTALSNSISTTVNPVLTPTVSIVDSPQGQLCQNTPVTFTATPTNEGTTPVYQWQVNGVNVGTNSATYTHNTTAAGDVVQAILTSSETCVSQATVASNTIALNVINTVVPSIAIVADQAMPVCDGALVTYTATPQGGGNNPAYQWYLNGAPVAGETQSTYALAAVNGDIISVELTSDAQCANPTTAISAGITVQALPYLVPAVSIASSPTGTICIGQNVTFTATPTNGGPAPTYQWLINSNTVGPNSDVFVTNTINPGDVIELVMTSNYQCLNQANASSNLITLQLNPPITVTVSAAPTDICAYEVAVLTATATGGDGGPYTYTWDTGENGSTISVSPDLSTTYTVSATDQCGTTPATASVAINVKTTPIADFTFSPEADITTLDDIFFNNTSYNANWWTWHFGDGETLDTTQSPQHNYTEANIYNIKLVATSADGCVDSLTVKINVRDESVFYVPNTFTPDANGKNELFRVYTYNIDVPYELHIFARNGEEVYNSEEDAVNGNVYWTGQKHNEGELLPEGMYVYYLYIENPYLDKKRRLTKGTILMLRIGED